MQNKSHAIKNIFLVGYRCTGKTSVGRTLADKLDLTFVDADQVISAETGADIAAYVGQRGWGAFREKERQVLSRLVLRTGQVIATGGGVVMAPDNRSAMRSNGTVIWLKASADTIRQRMQADAGTATTRPTLTGKGSLEEIGTLLADRNPLYARAAHHFLDTDGLSVAQVVEKIMAWVANNCHNS